MRFNILFNISNLILGTITFFFTYKYAITKLSAEILGVWSIAIALAGLSKVIENGVGISILKLSSEEIGKHDQIEKIIINGIIVNLFGTIILSLGSYCIINYFVNKVYGKETSEIIEKIIPYILINGVINSIAVMIISLLDGMKRNGLKLIITTLSSTALILSMIILMEKYELIGLVYAQIVQATVSAIVAIIMAIKLLKIKFDLSKIELKKIKKIFNFSRAVQITTLAHLLSEPVTKSILGYYNASNVVVYYDVSLKIVNQIRSIIVTANQTIVPYITNSYFKSNMNFVRNEYAKNLHIVFMAACIGYLPMILFANEVAQFILGEENKIFPAIFVGLIMVNLINVLTIPGYYLMISANAMKSNTIGHVFFSISNAVLALVLGEMFQAIGVVIGYGVALIISSILMVEMYNHTMRVRRAVVFSVIYGKLMSLILVIMLMYMLERFVPVLRSSYAGYLLLIKIILILMMSKMFLKKINDMQILKGMKGNFK